MQKRKISELPDAPYKKLIYEAEDVGLAVTQGAMTDASAIIIIGALELIRRLKEEVELLKGTKNTEQQLQPENGQQICTNKSCAGYSNGYCISFENCPVKAVSG